MTFEREGHVLFDGQRVVERRVLEEESDLLPDFVQLWTREAADFLSVDANGHRGGRLQSDDHFQPHTLARATPSKDRQGLTMRPFQIDSVQHCLLAERLAQSFYLNRRRGFLG